MLTRDPSISRGLPLENSKFLAVIMTENSIKTFNEDSKDTHVTSTPAQESIYSLQRNRRVEHYISGTGRNTASMPTSLLTSLSSNESSILDEDVSGTVARPKRRDRETECMRGCSVVLANLAKTYQDAGWHCWPTIMCHNIHFILFNCYRYILNLYNCQE